MIIMIDDKRILQKMNKLREQRHNVGRTYERVKKCPRCSNNMKYIYGEIFECPFCGYKELSDFGKVRDFLDKAGPQPAVIISQETGVPLDVIDAFLREGRVEIPDGSDMYIKCQSCGTDIRYGRYCPDCMLKITKNIGQVMYMPEVGEKPRYKEGKMHYLDKAEKLRREKNNRR